MNAAHGPGDNRPPGHPPTPPPPPPPMTPGPAGAVHLPPSVPGSNHPSANSGERLAPGYVAETDSSRVAVVRPALLGEEAPANETTAVLWDGSGGQDHPVRSLGEAVVPATSDAPMTDGSPEVPRQGLGAGDNSDPCVIHGRVDVATASQGSASSRPPGVVPRDVRGRPVGAHESPGVGFTLPQPPPFQIGTASYLAAPSLCLSLHRRSR